MSIVYSMTGYATVRLPTANGDLLASLRSVNGRNLDLHFHLGNDFAEHEPVLRRILKSKLRRGNVEVRLNMATSISGAPPAYNRDLLASYVAAFRAANAEFGLNSEPDLNSLLALPGVLEDAPGSAVVASEEQVSILMDQCIAILNQFRAREGAELASAIRKELAEIATAVTEILQIRESSVPRLQQRLRERLAALLGEAGVSPDRVLQEAAILADRSDVEEELTRLNVHRREVERLLDEGGEIGKRLDFLMQEMNRETNTILSKSSSIGELGLAITQRGVGLKANIERIREQASNLE